MTTQLYLVPLPDSQATTPPAQGVSSRVDVAGLLEEGGVATENIATERVDLRLRGHFRLGPTFSKKLADELDSLGESDYSGVALYDPDAATLGDRRGYYELSSVDVNPAHQTTTDAFQYDVRLDKAGTRETHWRAVKTSLQYANTGLSATGSGTYGGGILGGGILGSGRITARELDARVCVPAEASKVRWFDARQGSEVASVEETVAAEFGNVDRYDPTAASFDDPTLVYELPFDAEGSVDVRVWDDVGEPDAKYASFADGSGGTVEITQWTHAFHTGFEFDGAPIVDNGLLRVRFDEPNGVIEAWTWDDGSSSWTSVSLAHGDYALFDADLETIGPARVQVFAEFEDTTTGDIHATVLSIQRGLERLVVRQPSNGTVPTDLEDVLAPIASDQHFDAAPSQRVLARSEVK